MIVRSQNFHISVPLENIMRTEIQNKEPYTWIIVAVIKDGDRPLTLARYPSEEEAIIADTNMWLCKAAMYQFPTDVRKQGRQAD